MKKADLIIIAVVLAVAGVLCFYLYYVNGDSGKGRQFIGLPLPTVGTDGSGSHPQDSAAAMAGNSHLLGADG